MMLNPVAYGTQLSGCAVPEGCERVAHLRRSCGQHLAVDESLVFQASQCLREHFLRDPWNSAAQLTEAVWMGVKALENERRPLGSDEAQQVATRAGCIHCFTYGIIGIVVLRGFHKVPTLHQGAFFPFVAGRRILILVCRRTLTNR